MKRPLIRQYINSIEHPYGLFRSLGEFSCVTDRHNEPEMRVGGNSVVFKIIIRDTHYALKCYLRPKADIGLRIACISSSAEKLFVECRHLPDEIFIFDEQSQNYNSYDAVLSPWVEGHSLEYSIRKAVRDGNVGQLEQLALQFDTLAAGILRQSWAHGDIKPENIMLTEHGEMKLTDCDALYSPDIPPSGELGTWPYQHPRRNGDMYDKHIDDYPIALISVSLHAIALSPELFDRYNRKNNIIFLPEEIIAGTSKAYDEVKEMFARSGLARLLLLCRQIESRVPAIEGLGEMIANLSAGGIAADRHSLTAFRKGYLWGYCDSEGRTIVEPMFDSATEFRNGRAEVELCGHLHTIRITDLKRD